MAERRSKHKWRLNPVWQVAQDAL